MAVYYGQKEAIKFLLTTGADVNMEDTWEDRPEDYSSIIVEIEEELKQNPFRHSSSALIPIESPHSPSHAGAGVGGGGGGEDGSSPDSPGINVQPVIGRRHSFATSASMRRCVKSDGCGFNCQQANTNMPVPMPPRLAFE